MFLMVIYEDYFLLPLELLLRGWLETMVTLTVLGLGIALLYSSFRNRSLIVGAKATLRGFVDGLREIVTLPLGGRRIWAIAILSFKEAIRRRVLWVFAMFLFLFLFAGWYLPKSEEGELRIGVAFVTTAVGWLLFPLATFVVAMSFPNDLKQRTIQTIVTKPVHRLEIIVGRVIGFSGIFTLLLVAMGTVSLLYLRGQVSGEVREKQWRARVPIHAVAPVDVAAADGLSYPLMFKKGGLMVPQGINVGKEWTYRGHIEGQSTDAAHWYFRIDPQTVSGLEQIPYEFTFDIFKTTKGRPTWDEDERSGVWASIEFRNRKTGVSWTDHVRVNNHRITNSRRVRAAGSDSASGTATAAIREEPLRIPAEVLKGEPGEPVDIEVVAQCLTRNQFLGMAPYDLYFLADERSFDVNFLKGLFSVWLKVLFLTCVAVAASTVLNGFVTVLFTAMVYFLGIYYVFMVQLVTGQIPGGGPLESLIRLVTGDNQTNPLEETVFNRLAVMVDNGLLYVLDQVSLVVPNLTALDTTLFVAQGFDIPTWRLVEIAVYVFAYIIPVLIAGFFLLRSRELAS